MSPERVSTSRLTEPLTCNERSKLPITEAKPASELKIYSHSSLVYWWPVWAVGYLMAILTYSLGQQYQIGQDREWFHTSSNLGVFFFLTLFSFP